MTLTFKDWQEAETELGQAYLRLRHIIGHGAFNTPHAPTPEQVWETTEQALLALVKERDSARTAYHHLRRKMEDAIEGDEGP